MSNKQIDSKSNNSSITNSLLQEFSQIIQNFDKLNLKEIEPIINDYIFEGDLSIVIDGLVDLIFKELNKGEDRIVIKKHVLEFINNHKIVLYNYLLNDQSKSNSICLLGYFYYYGIETEVNEQRAIELYQEAAVLGNIVAQFNLVNEYIFGKSFQNYNLAFELSKKLAYDDYAYGCNNLGYCYENGIETEVNEQRAIELYQKAADLGNVGGINNLGWCYYDGIGTDINTQKVFESFQKAADFGNTIGINNLAWCYREGIGTNVNEQKAFELYQKAADLENITAIFNLIECYYEGIGTNIDKQKVFELYQKAANLGNSTAQYSLAWMYENGSEVKKDINNAIYWYKKSAKQGHTEAQLKLKELLKE
ncbi:uncharacterized protein OCT59_023630 [Rhizophagus irregularis]|uniref:Skt5p n=1 Tax=Rhizophagus irregularis (strain DAOM 197198w) TaxID=1432141 RepID=A0A015KWJ6_RHIIW|nr:Skt5p [Rhizophagus irregularis DAOM 197198w]UZO03222.1 hypothetical protein OCT59_023630 [Rhizophagus irregularis]